MALRLTHENLPAAYEYLRACEPFRRWKLPEADDVVFVVTRSTKDAGYHTHEQRTGANNEIGISARCVGSSLKLLEITAHEMIHLHQRMHGLGGEGHNEDFKRRAAQVCKHHVFDPVAFV